MNFADDQINPAELGVMDQLVARIPGARYVLVPAGPETIGHQTLTKASVWKRYLVELLR